jgi:uncharacterized protein (DUF927 family)
MSNEDEAGARRVVPIHEARLKSRPGEQGNAEMEILDAQQWGDGRFELRRSGVWFCRLEGAQVVSEIWLSGLVRVLAKVRSFRSNSWGRLLGWYDDDAHRHLWVMPAALLQGDGGDVRRALADEGLEVGYGRKSRELLLIYLGCWKTDRRARCVDRLGWNGSVYVLPDSNIGETTDEPLVFQSQEPVALSAVLDVAGTPESWRSQVADLARGNSRLLLAIAAAFAGPLLEIAGETGAGFHLRGVSSVGKTTALLVGASVWGNPKNVVGTWRATDNGLEGCALLHHDRLMVLDEISQVEPRAAAHIAYMLLNGAGKLRASRTGGARDTKTWKLLLLSSGEQSLAAKLAEDRRRSTAGQELRLLDVPADAGAGLGLFDKLNSFANGAELAVELRQRTAMHHGAVARAFIERVVADRDGVRSYIAVARQSFAEDWARPTDSSQVGRALSKFSLVAAGGELATKFGLTGLSIGECAEGVGLCFDAWRNEFTAEPASNREGAEALATVRAFIERHGGSRFVNLDRDLASQEHLRDRVGFTETVGTSRRWLFLREPFRQDVCAGLDHHVVVQALTDAGWLRRTSIRDATTKETLPGLGRVRVYAVVVPEDV